MTQDEYDDQMRRLAENAESARVALINARACYDGLCDEMLHLRIARREQLAAAVPEGEEK
jgi:hypothetical protein